MEVLLQTLVPLHIGNGEELFALDYVKYNSVYYRISQKQFLDFIKDDADALRKFENWVLETSFKIDNLKEKKKIERDYGRREDYNQELSRLERGFNLLSFIEQNTNKKNNFIEYLNKSDKIYKIRYRIEPKNSIRGFIKSGTNVPYVPGTSLKGAIRTALLYQFLLTKEDPKKLQGLIRNEIDNYYKEKNKAKERNSFFKSEDIKKRFAKKVEQWAFFCSSENDKGIIKSDDEKYDLMKLINVSDGTVKVSDLTLSNINLYLVSKQKDRRTGKLEPKATLQPQSPCVEAIAENSIIKSELDFDINFLFNIRSKIINEAIKQGNDKVWIGIRKKVIDVFNLDIDTLTKENLAFKKQQVLDYILNSIKEFSKAQLEFEKKWIREFSEKDYYNQFKDKIHSGYNTLFNDSGTLLHLGYTSGFFGLTEYMYIFPDPELKSLFKQVMEIFNIGDKPGAAKSRKYGEKYEANPDKFPKSRRFTETDGAIKPLGWLKFVTAAESIEIESRPVISKPFISYTPVRNEPSMPRQTYTPIDTGKPKYFTGKIKPEAQPIDAEVVKPGNPNFVKLYIEGIEYPIEMRGFSGILEVGKLLQVKINQLSNKGEIKQVGFLRFK